MKTYIPKIDTKDAKWFIVDANEQILGRMATKIADILRGKNKPTFTPHMDMGDSVIVINAEKIKLTGNKWKDKKYYRHSGYIGNLKEITAEKLLEKDPTRIIVAAVKGMLPKNKLQQVFLKKLRVFVGADHQHTAQKPELLEL